MVSRNRKIARRIGQAVANNVLDITGAVSGGAGVTVYATVNDLPTTGLTAGDEAFVSGSNRLYISNGTGWYSIGLVNTNPSITSVLDSDGGVTPFTLATDGSATVITITASDPEDIPLTYNYTVTSGSLTNGGGTTATVTQGTGSSSNIFTVTPTTNTDYLGNFDLTFTVSDGINQSSSITSFTLEFYIQDSKYTTLLLEAVDTSDNNNITDASSNNHTITVTGDAHAGTFSPYRHSGYSTYFDGTGDYLQTQNTYSSVGTGDFTAEAWIWIDTGYSETNPLVFASNNNGFNFGVLRVGASPSTNYVLAVGHSYVGDLFLGSTTTIVPSQWYHIAISRSSGTMYCFVNGQLEGSFSNSSNFNGTINYIGSIPALSNYDWKGYITDARFVSSAVYTSNFTPSVKRLTAVANTSLLTCHLPYIADGSTNNHTITVNGNTSTKAVSPFNNYSYSAADHGGSIFLDGTGDYLELPQVSALGSSHFEVSLWAYIKSSADMFLIDWSQKYDTGNGFSRTTDAPWLVLVSGQLYWTFKNGVGVNTDMIISSTVPLNQWIYVTVKRYSGDTKMYFNGIQVGSTYSNNNRDFLVGPDRPVIGANGYNLNNGLNGNITDLTVKLGTDVTDGSAPTVPTAPLSSTGTALHVKGTGASIIDKSQGANIALIGPGTGTSTESPFAGGKSLDLTSATETYAYVDGDSIVVNANEAYTFEFWMKYIGQRGVTGASIFDWGIHSNNNSVSLFRQNTGGYTLAIVGQAGFGYYSTAYDSLEDGTWKHFALSRTSSGDVKSFIDGSVIESYTGYTLSVANTVKKLRIGGLQNYNGYGIKMYIQGARLTKGLARYTANFTPPTAPLEG